MHLLIAEDNPINRRVAEKLAKSLGHDTSWVENGKEALERVSQQTFDAILMDIQMPVMDGLEATRQIRALALEPPPYIIAVTANAIMGDREICLAAGMDAYVSKPLRHRTLEEALAGVMAQTVEASAGAAIDWEQFDAIVDLGDPECLEIYKDFCELSRTQLRILRDANTDDFLALAHQLKGSTSTFGFSQLAQLLEAVESNGRLLNEVDLETVFEETVGLVSRERLL